LVVSFHLALPQTAISDQTPIDPALPGPNNLFGFANLGRFQVFPPLWTLLAPPTSPCAMLNDSSSALPCLPVSPPPSSPLRLLPSPVPTLARLASLILTSISSHASTRYRLPLSHSLKTNPSTLRSRQFSPSLRSAIFNVLFDLLQSDYVGVAYNDSLQVTNVIRASQRDQIPHP
jgi:hypothetical protein